jgi:hypothetical protein
MAAFLMVTHHWRILRSMLRLKDSQEQQLAAHAVQRFFKIIKSRLGSIRDQRHPIEAVLDTLMGLSCIRFALYIMNFDLSEESHNEMCSRLKKYTLHWTTRLLSISAGQWMKDISDMNPKPLASAEL